MKCQISVGGGLILVALCLVGLSIYGCGGTLAAYKAASDPGETAYVMSEHYESLLREANTLRNQGALPGSVLKALQEADRVAKPIVLNLRNLRKAYLDAQNATTEQQLQKGIDDATRVIADMVRAVNVARGSRTSLLERRIVPGASFYGYSDQIRQRGAGTDYLAFSKFGPRSGWQARSVGEPF